MYYIAVSPGKLADSSSNVRAAPNTTAAVVGWINSIGTLAERIGQENGWSNYKFETSETSGWIRDDVHWWTPLTDITLNVPFVSQNDANSDEHLNDCGIASTASILRNYCIDDTVEDLANSVGMTYRSLTSFDHMIRIAKEHRVPHLFQRPLTPTDIIRGFYVKKASVALVNYKYVGNKVFPHFIVAYGVAGNDVLIRDPYNALITKISPMQLARAMRYSSENGNLPWQGIIFDLKKEC